jgi:(1->4)-alpha-D-glucan 1-alpha-D-glucosylmutase
MCEFLACWPDARIKLATLMTLLKCRRDRPELFSRGDYQVLQTLGTQADCVCAFSRQHGESVLLSLVARFPSRLALDGFDVQSTIALPENLHGRSWRDLLSGRQIPVHDGCLPAQAVFGDLPAAVIVNC